MLPDSKVRCPATGFARSCREILAECDCPKFIGLKGKAADGTLVDEYGCADSFLPRLLIENAQMARQTGAAVESFRNEVVKASEATEQRQREALVAFARAGGPKLISGGSA